MGTPGLEGKVVWWREDDWDRVGGKLGLGEGEGPSAGGGGRSLQVKVGIGLVGAKFNMGPTRGGDKGELGVQ